MKIDIRKQKRKSLAFKLTNTGAVVLVPQNIDAESQQVKAFIEEAIAKLPHQENPQPKLLHAHIYQLVEYWQERLGVTITRLQIRTMKNKWGSISTAGTLTLAEALLNLPYELVEYVVVHELLHLKFPDHRKGWRVSMGMYLPAWRECEFRLQEFIADGSVCP